MTEDVAKQSVLTNFNTPMPGTLKEVLNNDISPREKISLNGLGMTKGKYGGLYMMLRTGL